MDLSTLMPEQQQALLNGPALAPPDGVIPDFANPPNNNRVASAALAICICAASFAFITRACSRIFVIRAIKVEDALGLIGFGTYVGYVYLNYWLLHNYGFFIHQWDIRLKDVAPILYHIYVGGSLYGVTVASVKAAILKEWSRIFVPWPTRNFFWWTCHALIFLNVAFYAAGLFVGNLACIPREKIWDKTIPGGKCIDAKISDLSASIVNVISDVLILALPQRVIWKLEMPLKKRIGISLVFTVGFLACVSASFRLSVTVAWFDSDDAVYSISALTLWAVAEMTCMFLVFCLPAAPKVFGTNGLVSKLTGSLLSLSTRKPSSSDPGSGSWNRPHTGGTVAGKSFHRIENDIPLQPAHTRHGQQTEPTRRLEGNHSLSDTAIIHTTSFMTGEDRVTTSNFKREEYHHQHPWIDDR